MYRQENDLCGAKEVPQEAYYGVQTVRALENFPITGLRVDSLVVRALGIVKWACAKANQEAGKLPDSIGPAIVQAAEEVAQGKLDEEFVVDPIQGGAGTSLHMNANEVISNRALEILGRARGQYRQIHPNVHVNMSQSTNDVIPTALRIALLRALQETVPAVEELAAALQAKAHEFRHVLKVGRTHLQDAVPIRLGQEFAAYAGAVRRDARRLRYEGDFLHGVNIGATAVGTGLNADPAYIHRVMELLREATGLPLEPAEDMVDATQNTDSLVAVSNATKAAAVNLTKIANDLRLMASGPQAGLGEIRLPAVQPGSTIMPGKVNPVMPEVVNQVAFQIMGNDLTVTMAAQAGQLELNVMQPVLIHNLLQSLQILGRVSRAFARRCVIGIEANEERCRQDAEGSSAIAAALNPYIGYDVASQVARESLTTGKSIRQVVMERELMSQEMLDRILLPESMVRDVLQAEHAAEVKAKVELETEVKADSA